jgi:hypothetical protein
MNPPFIHCFTQPVSPKLISKNAMKYLFITFAIIITLTGCSRGPAEVTVVNRSGVTVSNVMVSGPHFAASLGTMTPGMEAKMTVHPGGESRCWLSYETGTQKIDGGGLDYFRIGWMHPVSVTIGTDLNFSTPDGVTHVK